MSVTERRTRNNNKTTTKETVMAALLPAKVLTISQSCEFMPHYVFGVHTSFSHETSTRRKTLLPWVKGGAFRRSETRCSTIGSNLRSFSLPVLYEKQTRPFQARLVKERIILHQRTAFLNRLPFLLHAPFKAFSVHQLYWKKGGFARWKYDSVPWPQMQSYDLYKWRKKQTN